MTIIKTDATVEININTAEKMAKVNSAAFQTFAAETWYKLYRDWVPNDTGTLYESVRISPYQIEHFAPYANAVYSHNRNYRKDKAPMASARWDQAAAPSQKPKLVISLQKYIDAGRLNLDK